MDAQDGKIIERDIESEMKNSYIDYAMSVTRCKRWTKTST